MPCRPEQLMGAAMLAMFAAVRARMMNLENISFDFERLAVRLETLAYVGEPVYFDNEVANLICRIISSLPSKSRDKFWFVYELLEMLRCLGAVCEA